MHDPGALGAQGPQNPGQGLDPSAVVHAQHLAAGAGGIGEGAQQVENGAEPQFLADRQDMAHGAVVGGCEQDADPGFVQGAPLLLGRWR